MAAPAEMNCSPLGDYDTGILLATSSDCDMGLAPWIDPAPEQLPSPMDQPPRRPGERPGDRRLAPAIRMTTHPCTSRTKARKRMGGSATTARGAVSFLVSYIHVHRRRSACTAASWAGTWTSVAGHARWSVILKSGRSAVRPRPWPPHSQGVDLRKCLLSTSAAGGREWPAVSVSDRRQPYVIARL